MGKSCLEYKREWRKNNRKRTRASFAKWYKLHGKEYYRNVRFKVKPPLEKRRARAKVLYAIKTGKITRLPCEVCGLTKVEAHHPDYSKPLEVTWLCYLHHGEKHRQN